jgi:hypothetical protein
MRDAAFESKWDGRNVAVLGVILLLEEFINHEAGDGGRCIVWD